MSSTSFFVDTFFGRNLDCRQHEEKTLRVVSPFGQDLIRHIIDRIVVDMYGSSMPPRSTLRELIELDYKNAHIDFNTLVTQQREDGNSWNTIATFVFSDIRRRVTGPTIARWFETENETSEDE